MREILIVLPPYKIVPHEGFGGVEKVAVQRGRVLNSLGDRVSFVLPEGSELDFPSNTYFVRKVNIKKSDNERLLAVFFFESYVNLKIDKKFDVIINESSRYDLLNYLNFRRLFDYRKTIDVLHGNGMRGTKMNRPSWLKTSILGALNLHIHEKLKENGWRTAYFPNGIAIPEESNFVESPDDFFIFIGRLTPIKGPELAIEFAVRSRMKLYIFGPVQDREFFDSALKPKIDGKNIVYLGEQPWYVVESYLKRASALIFTSTFDDPQPAVLLEAISYGVPILATKPGYYSGFYDICNENNSVIADSLEDLISSRDRIFSLSRKKIYHDAKEQWSWENVAKKYYVPLFDNLDKL